MAARQQMIVTVLLAAGAGSCLLCAADSNPHPSALTQIPLELRHGAALVRARVNDSEPLTFKLDTGFGVTTLHPALVQSLGLKRVGSLTINGIAGKEQADWLSGATFDFGDASYSPRRVAMVPSDARHAPREQDGILGAGFFRRFVVELNPGDHTMTLHNSDGFNYAGGGEIIPLKFHRATPMVEATIRIPGREPLRAWYEIDSGCDGAICLGHDFAKANRLTELPGRNRASSRSGVGGSVATQLRRLPQFQMGGLQFADVAANLFRAGSPVDDDLAGHIGLDLLRRFKVIFDYSRQRMILEPLK